MRKIDKSLYVKLGEQLKEARLKKGYSLQDVADAVGKNKTSVKRYEDAEVRIDMDTLKKLSDLYGMQLMSVTATYDGKEIEHSINLYPRLEMLLPEDREFQGANKYFQRFVESFIDRFTHLDINLQKSILIMMNYKDDEINEIIQFLH